MGMEHIERGGMILFGSALEADPWYGFTSFTQPSITPCMSLEHCYMASAWPGYDVVQTPFHAKAGPTGGGKPFFERV